MSQFNKAVEKVLRHEGRYVNHPNDPGGATNYGISLRFLKQLGVEEADIDGDGFLTIEDIKAVTKEHAIRFYRLNFWDRYEYHKLPIKLDGKVFNISVNMGPRRAHICLQRAVKAAGGPKLKQDGILGPKSRYAISSVPSECLLAAYKSEVAGIYRLLAEKNEKLEVFLKGWLRRAYDD